MNDIGRSSLASDIPTTAILTTTNVKAEVDIDGLGLLCFSETRDRAEIGFLNVEEPPHPLLIWVDGVASPIEVPAGGTVVINSLHTGIGTQFRSPGDDRDFGLLICLNRVHGTPVEAINSEKLYARLFINNATFFTAAKSINPARLVEVGGANAEIELGQIGKIAGAYVYDGDVDLTIDGIPVDLSSVARPFHIEIKYQCLQGEPMPTPGSDYRHIYGVADVPDDRTYDLVYDGSEPPFLSNSARARVSDILRKMQDFLAADVSRVSSEDRDQLQAELEYAMFIVSCDVSCQLVTIGQETIELG